VGRVSCDRTFGVPEGEGGIVRHIGKFRLILLAQQTLANLVTVNQDVV
jgi:hypothetical protein